MMGQLKYQRYWTGWVVGSEGGEENGLEGGPEDGAILHHGRTVARLRTTGNYSNYCDLWVV